LTVLNKIRKCKEIGSRQEIFPKPPYESTAFPRWTVDDGPSHHSQEYIHEEQTKQASVLPEVQQCTFKNKVYFVIFFLSLTMLDLITFRNSGNYAAIVLPGNSRTDGHSDWKRNVDRWFVDY